MDISDPPHGSSIRTAADAHGVTFTWRRPGGGPLRYFFAIFVLAWLCAWAAGEVTVLGLLFMGGTVGLFLLLWLVLWTTGGIAVIYMLYLLLRPLAPASVTLTHDSFRYDTGTPPALFFNPFWSYRYAGKRRPFASPWRKRRHYEFPRRDCPEFVLEDMGDDQRLRFDDAAERVVIGETLTEPEREWLAGVLAAWRNG